MLRIIMVGMVAVVCITALLLVSYMIMFDAVGPATVNTIRRHQALRTSSSEEYQVLEGSSVESQFMTLNVQNCPSDTKRDFETKWNNSYWQEVDDGKLYLYSAFYDARFVYQKIEYHYVQVIGMSVGKIVNKKYYCTLWYSDLSFPISVETRNLEIWLEHWNPHPEPKLHHAYLFTCPIPLNIRDMSIYPDYVTISSKPCVNFANKLLVKKHGISDWKNKNVKRFVVCVKGMDFAKDLSVKLVEWLELVFLLGAENVTFYKYRIHKNMERVLQYYEKKGRAQVIPLTLPGDQPNEPKLRSSYLKRAIWQKRRNELVPYNDCLYRNMYLYEYIIPLDIDEVIMPLKSNTWAALLSDLKKRNPSWFKKYSSFSAQNTYFLDVYNSSKNPDIPQYYHMLQSRLRSANYSIYGHSVKSFVSTSMSKVVFNHYALESLYSARKTNLVMNSSIVQLNHYKDRCPREIYSQCQSKFLVHIKKDDTIEKYQKQLVNNADYVIKKLKLVGN